MVSTRSRLARLARVYGRGLLALVAFAVVFTFPSDLRLELQILAAWNAYAVVWLVLTWAHVIRPSTAGSGRWDLAADFSAAESTRVGLSEQCL